jgi:hypothetical protein
VETNLPSDYLRVYVRVEIAAEKMHLLRDEKSHHEKWTVFCVCTIWL